MTRRPNRQARAYQREFTDWLATADVGGPAVRSHRTVHYVRIEVAGLQPAIRVQLRPYNMAADVYWRGQHIDRIFDEDLIPVRDGDAYICRLCEENPERKEPPPRFASIPVMRQDHLFETFRSWCVDRLFPAKVLKLTIGNGFSAARLAAEPAVDDPDTEDVRHETLPLWV
jgi:hypothetical protein